MAHKALFTILFSLFFSMIANAKLVDTPVEDSKPETGKAVAGALGSCMDRFEVLIGSRGGAAPAEPVVDRWLTWCVNRRSRLSENVTPVQIRGALTSLFKNESATDQQKANIRQVLSQLEKKFPSGQAAAFQSASAAK